MKQMIMTKHGRARTTRSKQTNLMKTGSSDFTQNGNIRNNIQNSVEKYNVLAREALLTGDRIQAESYFQQAEHYLRLSNEYKASVVTLPQEEVEAPKKPTVSVNEFELSIDQELSLAQANL